MADTAKIAPGWAWERYQPSDKAPWTWQRAGHLFRRASFGSTWNELQTALKEGPDRTIDRLLKGGPGQAEFDQSTAALADSIARVNNGQQLRAWWLHRMLYSAASAAGKADAVLAQPLRHQQRQGAERPLHARPVRADAQAYVSVVSPICCKPCPPIPAMLVWLDGRDSKKGNPNENYARELMELF